MSGFEPRKPEVDVEIRLRDERIERLIRSNELLEAELKHEKATLQAVLESRSWRSTEPLRIAALRLGFCKDVITDSGFRAANAIRQRLKGGNAWSVVARAVRRVARKRPPKRLKVINRQSSWLSRDRPMPREEGRRDTVLAVTHIVPFPPRAGNEYRLYRLLRWMKGLGYRVVLVVCPLSEEEITEARIQECQNELCELVVCHRDGRVHSFLDEPERTIANLRGVSVSKNWDIDGTETRNMHLERLEKAFCPDVLLALMVRLNEILAPSFVLCTYIFMTRLLPALGTRPTKIVDTIDVFSSKRDKVIRFGIRDASGVSPEDERERLLRADLVLAIHKDEAMALSALVPDREIIVVGVDFDTAPDASAQLPFAHVVLVVASDNPMNEKGVRDFLRFAWPLVIRELPHARLVVAGSVCRVVQSEEVNVSFVGPTDQLDSLYCEAKAVINPAVAGTGLKIKTVEALAHWRPVVTWQAGVDGLDDDIAMLCHVARDWYGFYLTLTQVLKSTRDNWYSTSQKAAIRSALSSQTVYRALEEHFQSYQEEIRHT